MGVGAFVIGMSQIKSLPFSLYTSWLAVVTQNDSLKSYHNHCVIEHFRGYSVLSLCVFFLFSIGIGTFLIGLNQ